MDFITSKQTQSNTDFQLIKCIPLFHKSIPLSGLSTIFQEYEFSKNMNLRVTFGYLEYSSPAHL